MCISATLRARLPHQVPGRRAATHRPGPRAADAIRADFRGRTEAQQQVPENRYQHGYHQKCLPGDFAESVLHALPGTDGLPKQDRLEPGGARAVAAPHRRRSDAGCIHFTDGGNRTHFASGQARHRHSLRADRVMERQPLRRMPVSINVSSRQFNERDTKTPSPACCRRMVFMPRVSRLNVRSRRW